MEHVHKLYTHPEYQLLPDREEAYFIVKDGKTGAF